MTNRLGPRHMVNLDQRLASARSIGIFCDVDGTLSEIQDRPDLAYVSDETAELLGALDEKYALVALVSGRPAREAARMVGQPAAVYLGNHGLERLTGDELVSSSEIERAMAGVRDELADELPVAPGLVLEDKGSVLALHFRLCRDPAAIAKARGLAERLAKSHGLKFQAGREIVELKPANVDKGTAVLGLAREFNLDHVIYIGDDRTDMDAFIALGREAVKTGLSVTRMAVVADESPAGLKENSDYWVTSVNDVLGFLVWLLSRTPAS